jgi:photosystem II stability/assembly factor-like uncharacterized protein
MKTSLMKPLALAALCLIVFLAARPAGAQILRPLGPEGGDVLSLGQDPANPRHIFLGTADGHIFGSDDGGEHWELRGRTGPRLDSVLTAIVVDPRDAKVIYAATWAREPGSGGGGIFRSDDSGRTWFFSGLAGEDVRALVVAPPGPGVAHDDTLIAGTLDGVYRSRDSGRTWQRISPLGDAELKNVDSIAVDPTNAEVIYAGTFHLPWKTTDGGLTWNQIHSGMIDDSDVMSILVDRAAQGRVYASACSGIYRSDTGGAIWQKVQGIPYTARRTVEILQDPSRPEIVFAATTEGLWKSSDAGSTWQRITPADWSVTAMILGAGAADRVVIGVEQHGVLVSDDGGANFHEANSGFFHREMWGAAPDMARPGRFLVALANVPDFLLSTDDAGQTWRTTGQEPAPGTLRRIYASPDGWWATLAAGGLLRYDQSKSAWVRAGRFTAAAAAPRHKPARPGSANREVRGAAAGVHPPAAFLNSVVTDMAFASQSWYAATSAGLLASTDSGTTWSPVRIGALTKLPVESVRVSADGMALWIASNSSIAHSADGGVSWDWIDWPPTLASIQGLEVSEDHAADGMDSAPILLAETYTGLLISRDAGKTWEVTGHGLPETPVRDLAMAGPVFLATLDFGDLYLSRDSGRTWRQIESNMADGLFSSVFVGPPLPGEVSIAGTSLVFYATSATEGLYAIDIEPKAVLVPGGDTAH